MIAHAIYLALCVLFLCAAGYYLFLRYLYAREYRNRFFLNRSGD